jgi:nucleoside-diphosphate-sugar epimerase
MRILITGGAGFIGSALIRHLIQHTEHEVLNLDKLTYAGNLESLTSIASNSRYEFVQADIIDQPTVSAVLARFSLRRSCIWLLSPMSTVRLTVRRTLSRPISSAPTACWKLPGLTGSSCRTRQEHLPLPSYFHR